MSLTLWMATSVVAVFACLVAAFPNLCIGALNLVRSRGAREPYVYGPTPRLVVLSFAGGFAPMFALVAAFSVTPSAAVTSSARNFPINAQASTTQQAEAVYK